MVGLDDLFKKGSFGEVRVVAEGCSLVEHRIEMDRAEAVWLERLAEFDRDGLWALDGHLSCAAWLVWRLNMARSTAFEKLGVAHELYRRPMIVEAFRDGRLSYSAVRAITRMDRPDPDVDHALVELASGEASILDVERVVRSYQLYADQETPPGEEVDRMRQVRIRRGHDGTGRVLVTLIDLELEEFAATFQAFLDLRFGEQPVDESSAGDRDQTGESKRADAFMDLVRTALEHVDGGRAAGDDRYLVHLVRPEHSQLLTLRRRQPQRRAALLPPRRQRRRIHLPDRRPGGRFGRSSHWHLGPIEERCEARSALPWTPGLPSRCDRHPDHGVAGWQGACLVGAR